MKRFFKILLYALGGLLLLALMGAAYIYSKGIPTYKFSPPPEVVALQVPRDSAMIERGAKLAVLLCADCHRGEGGKMTGRFMPDMPKELAPAYSLNITQDSIHGIGTWSDGELYYFLRTGIRKDGSWSPPFMPKFPLMADADLKSVIAWLHSDDPALVADSHEFPPNKWNFLVKLLSNVAFSPPPFPEKTISIPDTTNKIAFGKYVADALCACYACHSTDFTKQDPLNPEKSLGFYGGGNPLLNYEGELVPSSNITMDKKTGIGNWTQQQFLEATKYGKNPKGGPLYFPMFPHTTLTDTEVNAVWAYLQTVPPIQNQVNRYKPKIKDHEQHSRNSDTSPTHVGRLFAQFRVWNRRFFFEPESMAQMTAWQFGDTFAIMASILASRYIGTRNESLAAAGFTLLSIAYGISFSSSSFTAVNEERMATIILPLVPAMLLISICKIFPVWLRIACAMVCVPFFFVYKNVFSHAYHPDDWSNYMGYIGIQLLGVFWSLFIWRILPKRKSKQRFE